MHYVRTESERRGWLQLKPETEAEGERGVEGVTPEELAEFDAIEIDGAKLATTIASKLATASDEEGVSHLVGGSRLDPTEQLTTALTEIWQAEAVFSEASRKVRTTRPPYP